LLDARPDVTDAEFGDAIGRGYSWVSAFRHKKRNANDIELLCAIARFFGVTVGYLLGEQRLASDPHLAQVLEAWPKMSEQSRKAIAASVRAFADR